MPSPTSPLLKLFAGLSILRDEDDGRMRTSYARSTPLVSHGGKLVSARSKAKDSACSQAASEWRTGKTTPDTFKTLARCRNQAAGHKQAGLHRAAGNEAKAQAAEHRANTGKVGEKTRGEMLKAARAERAKRQGAKQHGTVDKPIVHPPHEIPVDPLSLAREIAAKGRALTERAKASGRVVKLKPTSEAHKEAAARVADALDARHDLNRAIGQGDTTPGFRSAFHEMIKRKTAAAQPALKAARAEQRRAVGPKVAEGTGPTPATPPKPSIYPSTGVPGPASGMTPAPGRSSTRGGTMGVKAPTENPPAAPSSAPTRGGPPVVQPWTRRKIDELKARMKDADPANLATFASQVKDAVPHVPRHGYFGEDKVFVGDLHQAYQQAHGPILLDRFKARLAEANNARHLDLSRADMVEAMDPRKVAESETPHMGARFHFLRVPPGGRPRRLTEQEIQHAPSAGTPPVHDPKRGGPILRGRR